MPCHHILYCFALDPFSDLIEFPTFTCKLHPPPFPLTKTLHDPYIVIFLESMCPLPLV